jgi:hypothetical protein
MLNRTCFDVLYLIIFLQINFLNYLKKFQTKISYPFKFDKKQPNLIIHSDLMRINNPHSMSAFNFLIFSKVKKIKITVFLLILKRERDRRVQKHPHQNAQGWS